MSSVVGGRTPVQSDCMAVASRSAVMVTLVRCHLTWMGVVDDPYAMQMLPPNGRRAAAAFRLPGLRRVAQHHTLPYLAARTLVFDRFVREALDDGIRQVVIVGAGYDSRSWRMARPDVTFYEVDQPATQALKRARAPQDGPVYVAADVTDPGLRELVVGAGFRPDQRSAFVLEGLAVYLEEQQVADLLRGLAELGHDGSRLAVSFERGFERRPGTRLLAEVVYRRSRETKYFRLDAADAPTLLEEAGWTVDRMITASELRSDYLEGTPMEGLPETRAFIATATR
jgi:methyltransferase (TIGR00027 family)